MAFAMRPSMNKKKPGLEVAIAVGKPKPQGKNPFAGLGMNNPDEESPEEDKLESPKDETTEMADMANRYKGAAAKAGNSQFKCPSCGASLSCETSKEADAEHGEEEAEMGE